MFVILFFSKYQGLSITTKRRHHTVRMSKQMYAAAKKSCEMLSRPSALRHSQKQRAAHVSLRVMLQFYGENVQPAFYLCYTTNNAGFSDL